MSYSLTKQNDGDLSLGNLRGELVNLTPSLSDYATGGYLIEGIGGNPLTAGNVGMDKILAVVPCGDSIGSGWYPIWDTATQKLLIREQSAATGQLAEVGANTDLSAVTFQLLLIGL